MTAVPFTAPDGCPKPRLVWDWDAEREDRKEEAKADRATHGAQPFEVDRKVLKDVVHEKMGAEVARIKFLGAGTFHKGYLVTLVDYREVVARVARRFISRLKTESEVATMLYLRQHTTIPVPTVYYYDSNPYNRLGGEFIIMSKASGIPLSRVFHSMPHNELIKLMDSIVSLLIPLFAHRFSHIGSLYLGPEASTSETATAMPTPTLTSHGKPLCIPAAPAPTSFHVGPIISWPFFGSGRGELAHPAELNRGPWSSTHAYLTSCVQREVDGVVRENEGKSAPHKLHLDPDEIHASRHHRLRALPDDQSDQSDEWDWEESEGEWEGPGDSMYRDYRRMQRTTFLVAHLKQREEKVALEMARFLRMMERLGVVNPEGDGGGGGGVQEEFAIDCHDLSLENVFVDEVDHSKITCIIDWESTTTRPLWAAAHVPTFLQSSPFTAKLFRATVEKHASKLAPNPALAHVAAEWLHHEAAGARLRMAHRCVEWDGWEEGLVESILGPEEQEEDWFLSWRERATDDACETIAEEEDAGADASGSPTLAESLSDGEAAKEKEKEVLKDAGAVVGAKPKGPAQVAKVVAVEKEKEKLLNATGDYCGGRGGELGRRLEAWLYVDGDGDGRVGLAKRWEGEEEDAALQ